MPPAQSKRFQSRGFGGVQGQSPWPFVALAFLTALRLLVAANAPLSPDEAYYRIWSRVLQPGYLDHPPMVALWIRAGEFIAGPTVLGVRLLAPLAVALGSVLLWDAGRVLAGPRAGLIAAALLNATLFVGIGAVVMTPDTPLLLFWVAALWSAVRATTGAPLWWLAVGLSAGLALDSKYTALLFGLGLALWLIATPAGRAQLRFWPLWAGLAIAAACAAPVIAWNAAHHWASFAKQGGRNADFAPARALQYEAELLAGQFGLATPGVFVLGLLGAWRARTHHRLLLCLILVPAAVFLWHALGDRVQANWPAILWTAACLAAACTATAGWRPATALGLTLAALVYWQAAGPGLPLPRHLDPVLMRMAGWNTLSAEIATMRATQHASFVAADEYGLAAELAWHLPGPVIGVEPRWSLFALPRAELAGQTGLLVQSTRRREPPDPARFPTATPLGELPRGTPGRTAERYRLYRVTAAPSPAAVLLPGRPS